MSVISPLVHGVGVWLTCAYDLLGDTHIRISTVRGDMAVLSAVAFDPVPAASPVSGVDLHVATST